MVDVVALDADTHRHLKIRTEPSAALGDARNFVPLMASEFAPAAAHFPIFLVKNAETGIFFVGGVLGFSEGENLLLGEGKASYRPLSLRREPFYIAGELLAIDPAHPRVGEAAGEAVFEADGQPSAFLRGIQQVMTQLQRGVAETEAFTARMLALKLVEPIDISLSFDNGERCDLEGLYTISKDALADLPDEEALAMFRAGHLQLAYSMIGSLEQVSVLAQRRNDRLLDVPTL